MVCKPFDRTTRPQRGISTTPGKPFDRITRPHSRRIDTCRLGTTMTMIHLTYPELATFCSWTELGYVSRKHIAVDHVAVITPTRKKYCYPSSTLSGVPKLLVSANNVLQSIRTNIKARCLSVLGVKCWNLLTASTTMTPTYYAFINKTENTHAEPIFINETATCHLPCCKNVVSCNNMIMNYCNNTIMYELLVLVHCIQKNTVILCHN